MNENVFIAFSPGVLLVHTSWMLDFFHAFYFHISYGKNNTVVIERKTFLEVEISRILNFWRPTAPWNRWA